MTDFTDHGFKTPDLSAAAVFQTGVDRRRPGRRTHVDLALIPLLRTPGLDARLPEFDLEEERLADRAPSRGILVGIAMSALLWAGGIAAVSALLF